jgi:hypothetical protein
MPPAAGVRNLQIPLLPIPSGDFWRRRQRRRHSPIPYNPWGLGFQDSNIVPEFIGPVFAKTRPKRSFPVIENERFGLVFAKTRSINSDTGYTLAVSNGFFIGT